MSSSHGGRGYWSAERVGDLRHLGPEVQTWRWAVLNALDLLQTWGRGPISARAWIARYRPDAKRAAAEKAWERMKQGLTALGLPYHTIVIHQSEGSGAVRWAMELGVEVPGRVERLVARLDAWLFDQPNLDRVAVATERTRRWRARRAAAKQRRETRKRAHAALRRLAS